MENRDEDLLLRRLSELEQGENMRPIDRIKGYYELFSLVIEEGTKVYSVHFTTLFSRLAYLGAMQTLHRDVINYSHQFRRRVEQKLFTSDEYEDAIILARYVCRSLLKALYAPTMTVEALPSEVAQKYKPTTSISGPKQRLINALIFEVNPEAKTFKFFDDADAVEPKYGKFDVANVNEMFTPNFLSLHKTFPLPQSVNMLDVSIDDDGHYIPKAIVINPDHLFDVTSVAECFKDFGVEPFLYLVSKFKPNEATKAILIGNLVNVMLDELIANDKVVFTDLFQHLFSTSPTAFACLDDAETRDVLETLKVHFYNLKASINENFARVGINADDVFLEPSFYSRDYGIQGRLDLLHKQKQTSEYQIIELKSGKTFKPNAYGINASHYIQTILYDFMMQSVFGDKTKRQNYILYSKESQDNLRHAIRIAQIVNEPLKLRNDLMAIEQKLRSADKDNSVLRYIKPSNFPLLKGFNQQDVIHFENIYTTLDDTEKEYFNHYTAFIAREHALAKTGEHGVYKSNGHAALWLESDEEKKERFALLTGLTIVENRSYTPEATITFAKAEGDDSLTNMRIGDIGVIYPLIPNEVFPILKAQIFKCTVIEIAGRTIKVKLRNIQKNKDLFVQYTSWAIEQDNLDSGFNSMYKSLFGWAAAGEDYRKLILGRTKPALPKSVDIDWTHFDANMTDNQRAMMQEIIEARDYYLLWGPPGTGKTSVMLKNLVKYLHGQTTQSILLLAYTNRAVDEICDAISSISPEYKEHFFRLGSSTSTGDDYTENLLDGRVKTMNKRHEVLTAIRGCRIYVSTVSSIVNRPDIFAVKDFDTAIIDEASQIIEPMLVGFLNKFKKFVLIGDHKQLPAVVVQSNTSTQIQSEMLQNIGIVDTRVSLFERMYIQAKVRGDQSRIGILNEQGRMHRDIMAFPNTHFYEGQLTTLTERQEAKTFLDLNKKNQLLSKRIRFFPTPTSTDINWKTNENEANAIVETILSLRTIYDENQRSILKDSIGIIAPYRAQLALIRHKLEQSEANDLLDVITIDTVERYQGGARDIIIISFCVNRFSQLDSLVSTSSDGTDRKLNVALTRAREHIIMFGNEEILRQNGTYRALMEVGKE